MEDLRPLEVAQAKDLLTKAYDQVASAWDRHVVPATAAVRERLLELAQPRSDERVLEVGTGTGSTALLAAQRAFHVGDAFLASLGFPSGVVAQASNGDTVKVIGSGELNVVEKEADGSGTFEHRSPTGSLLASGTWEATELISFTNFGGQAGLPPDFRGGSAVIRVHVVGHPAADPSATIEFDATLTVDCKLGNFPPGFTEGITFNAGFINFNQRVSGVTVFVADD